MSYNKLNKQASDFMKKKKHKKGAYSALQKTATWANAKKKLLDDSLRGGKLICPHCHRPIDLTKETAILHHKKYIWNDLFNPKYITFMHHLCHQRTHRIKANYRRRKYR